MRLRNNIFAAAFDYLKREKGIKTQKQLAKLMDVSEDTITRILKDRTEVTEDIITKLQTASGCIFNLQWLRGEDAFNMLAIDAAEAKKEKEPAVQIPDMSSVFNAALAAKDETITTLKGRVADLQNTIADKDEIIFQLRKEISELYRKLNAGVGLNYTFPIGVAEDKKIR